MVNSDVVTAIVEDLPIETEPGRIVTPCGCFAEGCPDWPMRLFLVGLVNPSTGLVMFILQVRILKTLRKARIAYEKRCNEWNLVLSNDRKSSWKLQQDTIERLTRRDIIICGENLLRGFAACSGIKVFEFLLRDAHIFHYRGDTGLLLCLLALIFVYFSYSAVISFVELYLFLFIWSTVIDRLTQVWHNFRGQTLRHVRTRNRAYKLSANRFCIGLILIMATVLTIFTVLTIQCDECRPKSGSNEDFGFTYYHFEMYPMEFTKDNVVTIDIVWSSLRIFFSGGLILGSVAGFVLLLMRFEWQENRVTQTYFKARRVAFLLILTSFVVGCHRMLHNGNNFALIYRKTSAWQHMVFNDFMSDWLFSDDVFSLIDAIIFNTECFVVTCLTIYISRCLSTPTSLSALQ